MEVPVCAMILSTIGRPSDVVCGILAPNWKKDSGVHLVLTTTIARIWEFALRMEVHAYVTNILIDTRSNDVVNGMKNHKAVTLHHQQ